MKTSVFTSLQLGNVFLTGEAVRIGLARSGTWQLRNLAGEVVQGGRHRGPGVLLHLDLPAGERGHYQLHFTDAATRSRAGTALAVLEPFDLSAVSDSPFGICTHFGQLQGPDTDLAAQPKESADAVPLLHRGGFKTHRDKLTWKRTEPVRGACVFPNAHRRYMAACASHDVSSLIILNNNRHYDGGNTPHTDDGLNGFANYTRQIVRRYGAQLRAVEVWNEFNGTFSKGPAARRPEGYFRLLERTYRAVKAERPDLTVVAPAAVTLPFGWLERLFSLGALRFLDAVSVHPYIYPRQPDTRKNSLDALLRRLQALIKKYNGGTPKPVYLSELGWPTHRGLTGVSGLEQARYAVRSLVLSLSVGVDKVYWYTLLNTGTNPLKREHNFGLLRHPDDPLGAYTPKPAYVALAVLARQLTGATFVRREVTPKPAHSVLFEQAGEPLRVVWAPKRGGQDVRANLDLRAERPLTATDMMGKTVSLEPRGGRVRVAVSGSPLYIQGQASLEDPALLTPDGVLRRLRQLFG